MKNKEEEKKMESCQEKKVKKVLFGRLDVFAAEGGGEAQSENIKGLIERFLVQCLSDLERKEGEEREKEKENRRRSKWRRGRRRRRRRRRRKKRRKWRK